MILDSVLSQIIYEINHYYSVLSVKVILFSELDNGSQRLTCLITKAVNLICYLKAHRHGRVTAVND